MVLSVGFDPLFVDRLGPGLEWNAARLQVGRKVQQMLYGIGGHPEAGEIDLAVGCAPRRGLEIDFAVRRPRHVLDRMVSPLRGGGGGHGAGDHECGQQSKSDGVHERILAECAIYDFSA